MAPKNAEKSMRTTNSLFALALAALPAGAMASDYLGTLKAPSSGFVPSGVYSFANIPAGTSAITPLGDQTLRLKLGYKSSRYLAVESEFIDGVRSADMFSS